MHIFYSIDTVDIIKEDIFHLFYKTQIKTWEKSLKEILFQWHTALWTC